MIAKDDLIFHSDTEKRLTKGKSYKIISGDLSKKEDVKIINDWDKNHIFTFKNLHKYFEL